MNELIRVRDHIREGNIPPQLVFLGAICTMPPMLCVVIPILAALLFSSDAKMRDGLPEKDIWKVRNFQRITIYSILLWMLTSIRDYAPSFFGSLSPSQPFQQSMWLGLIGSLVAPICIFLLALQASISGARLLSEKLRANEPTRAKRMQQWTDATFMSFMACFVFSVFVIFFTHHGVGDWLANWLIASGRDANLKLGFFESAQIHLIGGLNSSTVLRLPPASEQFVLLIKFLVSSSATILLMPQAVRLSAFLTALSKQISSAPRAKLIDTFLRTLRAPRTTLKLREKNALVKNVARTLCWLGTCYLLLFGLLGFVGGPLGAVITGWFDACIADANTGMIYGATANHSLRIFCAAIFALYGTVPLAVTGCVFLPYFKRKEIVLTEEGAIFPDGPGFNLRVIHLWTDFKSVDVKLGKKGKLDKNTKLIIKFHSGGRLTLGLGQLDKRSFDKFMGAIDEHAGQCVVSDAAVGVRADIRAEIAIDGNKNELGTLSAESFQSTIFVPHDQGAWLPNGECRVVRLLASRPLSCVYLVRMNTGALAIAKQFFLADTNDAQAELRKTFEREYELLRKINHPRISKVLDVFHRDESTYLLLEHASGIDMRNLVAEEGAQGQGTVIDWALEICDIMIALHDQDPPIVHRDLTPDNLILAQDGSLRIIDFGAAHQFMEGITGTIIGKQCYVSAEQLQGQAGPPSDVYSFGCTLYYLLTGFEPIALTKCVPSTKIDVSDAMNDFVMACTEFEQEARPQTFHEVKERLLAMKSERAGHTPEKVLEHLAESCVIQVKEAQRVDQWN